MADFLSGMEGITPTVSNPVVNDQAASQPVAAPIVEPPVQSDGILDQYMGRAGKVAAADRSMALAITRNPDEYARYQRLSKQMGGWDPELLMENADAKGEAERREKMGRIDINTLVDTSPKTLEWLSNPRQAILSQDDTPSLTAMETLSKNIWQPWKSSFTDAYDAPWGDKFGAFKSGQLATLGGAMTAIPGVDPTLRAMGAGAQGLKGSMFGLQGMALETMGADTLAKQSIGYAKANADEASAIRGDRSGMNVVQRGVLSGVESMTQMALLWPLSFSASAFAGTMAAARAGAATPEAAAIAQQTARTLGFVTPMAASTGGNTYAEDRAKGVPIPVSLAHAMSDAVVEGGTEMLGFGKFLKESAGMTTNFAKAFLKSQPQEQAGEILATVGQDFNKWAVIERNKGKSFEDFIYELPEKVLETVIATATMGAGHIAMGAAVDASVGKPAQANADNLRELFKHAAESLTNKRSPETFAQFVQSVADAHNGDQPANVYIDAGVLNQVMTEAGLDTMTLLPSVAEQMQEAGYLNTPMEIPVGEFMSALAGKGLDEKLVDHLRTDPNAPSLAETKEFGQKANAFFEAESTRIMEENSKNETFKAGAQEVQDHVEGIIRAQNTKLGPDAIKTNASLVKNFYVVAAGELGITPSQLMNGWTGSDGTVHAGYRLSAPGASAVGGELNQGAHPFANFSREQFLGNPKITSDANAKDLKPNDFPGLKGVDAVPFLQSEFTAKFGDGIAAVYEGGKVIASYQGNTLVVDKKYRRQGIGEELVYQYRMRNSAEAPAKERTKKSQALQEKVWARIEKERANILHQSVSTRTPSEKGGRADPHLTSGLAVDYADLDLVPKFVAKLASVVSKYTTFKRGPRKPEKILESFIEQSKDNLLWLYDQVPEATRARSKLWYEGGRKIVDRWVDQYQGKYTDAQMAGVIAVMSPQMAWDNNVTLAERIIAIFTNQQNTAWSPEMEATAGRIYKTDEHKLYHDAIRGKRLNELTDGVEKAMWLRAYDETYNPRAYRQVSPEGGFGDTMKTMSGKETNAGWLNGHGPIAKAISILEDGSMPNISRVLGTAHKVRNFYNNIYDPTDNHSVTIDTHAMAGAHLMPFGSSSQEVLDGFSDAGKNSELGLSGYYVLYAEAFRRAAAERGILPREMQAVTWEAIRRMYTPAFKTRYLKDPALKAELDNAWVDFSKGKGSIDDVRQKLITLAGGIQEPGWHGSDTGLDVGAPASSYASDLLERSWVGRTSGHRDGNRTAGPVSKESASGVLNQSAESRTADQTETPQFKQWSNDAPLVKSDEAETYGFKTGEKIVVEAFHGTKRPDRVGTAFKKKRATSGPMSYFTSSPELGSSYATGKSDTSLAEEDQDYANWFKIKFPGDRSTTDIVRAWYRLDAETKAKIVEMAPKISLDPEGSGEIVVREDNTRGNGSYDQNLRETQRGYDKRGNPIKAMVEDWLNSGNLYNDEEQFMEVLRIAGVPMKDVTYDSPFAEYPFVYKTFIQMQQPLVTGQIPQAVTDALNAAAKRDRSKAQAVGADMWDKNTKTLRDWVEEFNREDNTHVWTSIPDKVTKVLSDLGYDGIVDWSGKGGGHAYPVYIPFEENQVKSAIGNNGKFGSTSNILKQESRGTFNPTTLTLTLTENADLSTFAHEAGHFFLTMYADLAAMPDAPAKIKNDMDTILKWFGVADLATWHGMTLEQQRPHHEQLAESLEQYLFTGEAPSIELKSMYRKIADWMKRVYKDAQSFVATHTGAKLNPEISAVFDRMLASDAAIDEANAARNLNKLFKTAAEGGMTDQQFAAYIGQDAQQSADAKEDLRVRSLRDMKWLENRLNKIIGEMQKDAAEKRKVMRNEVASEVWMRPVYQAWQFLTARESLDVAPPAGKSETEQQHAQAVADWKSKRAEHEITLKASVPAKLWKESAEGQKTYRKESTRDAARKAFLKTIPGAITDEIAFQLKSWEGSNPRPVLAKAKADPNQVDPSRDTLIDAIAKLGGLSRVSAQEQLGVHPANFSHKSNVFGKPVFRAKKGQSAEHMVEKLLDYGYLDADSQDRSAMTDLEEKLNNSLGGSPVYSYSADQDFLQNDPSRVTPENLALRPGGRLDTALVRSYGTIISDKLEALRMTRTDALHPDDVAAVIGFESGDEMLKALAEAQKPRDEIEALTDQRMLEKYGDITSPEALRLAANEAIHNDAHLKFLATELAALNKNIGSPALLMKVVKDAARALVGSKVMFGSKTAKAFKPWVYQAAEVRAGKAAEVAMAKGKREEAAQQKRAQMLNHAAVKESHDALREINKTLAKLKLMTTMPESKLESRDMAIVSVVRAILGEHGIGNKVEKAQTYLDTMGQYEPALRIAMQKLITDANTTGKPYTDMTVDEFRDFADNVKGLWQLAKQEKQIEIDGKVMLLKDAQNQVYEQLEKYGIPDQLPGEYQAVTKEEDQVRSWQEGSKFIRRVESWAGEMDMGQKQGPIKRFIVSQIRDAVNEKNLAQAAFVKEYVELLQTIEPTLTRRKVYASELYDARKPALVGPNGPVRQGYTFGAEKNGIAMLEIQAALLHTGNESNLEKLLLGRGWADQRMDGTLDTTRWQAFQQRMIAEGVITKANYDFAQGVWNLTEKTKPMAQKAHRAAFGKYFHEVTANEFTNQFGTYVGGYVPAIMDSALNAKANIHEIEAQEREEMAVAFPAAPAKGFTMSRTGVTNPLKLDLRLIPQHIDKVMNFAYLSVPIKHVQAIIKDERINSAFHRIDPAAVPVMLLPWLARTASQTTSAPIKNSGNWMRKFDKLRARAGAQQMMGNISNTVQQVTGLSTAAAIVNAGEMARATGIYVQSPPEFIKTVAKLSPYMATRISGEIHALNGVLGEILLNPTAIEKAEAFTMRHAYFLQSAVDNAVSPIIWMAAYNQAKAEAPTTVPLSDLHVYARRVADEAVRSTQGSNAAVDISRLEASNTFVKLFTQYFSWFNTQGNFLMTQWKNAGRLGGYAEFKTKARLTTLAYIVPSIVAEVIAVAFKGGPDDDDNNGTTLDNWIMAMAMAPIKFALATVPLLGHAAAMALNRLDDKLYNDRYSSPVIGFLESAFNVVSDTKKAITGAGGKPSTVVHDVLAAFTLTTGIVTGAIERPVKYLADVAAGKVNPTGPVDMTRGIITGTASPASKSR